jgi:DNA-directed RNA polymerase specialized sigma24 family protein
VLGPDAEPARAGNLFPETRWTLVLAAKDQPERRRQVLEELVRPRYKALYVIARKRGLGVSEAEDAVQGFLTQLLEGDLLTRLDPEKGRLRSYLKTALAHYLSNLWQQGRAEKRGGGQANLDLSDVEAWLTSDAPTPEELFDRAWALELFQSALQQLELEFTSGRRAGPFALLEELFGFASAPPYEELSRRHGMSVPQLKSFVHRARVRLRQLLRERVADTLSDPAEIELEMRVLFEVMAA